MRKILTELYNGNIHPGEKKFLRDSAYGENMNVVVRNEELLRERLQEEERQWLAAWTDAQIQLNGITAQEYFIDGFRLGARFMLAIMGGEDGCLRDLP